MHKIALAVMLSLATIPTAAAAEAESEQKQENTVAEAAAYKPRTEHDNTPYRFNMHQEGRQMTADEFDAWMKARGVRVARGAAAPAANVAADKSEDKADGK